MISIDSVKCVDDILAKAIDMVEQNISCYCTQPGVDFTRIRALPAGILIRFLIQKQAKALNQELSDFFVSKVPPSASAFCQQRSKLDPEALERVMHLMTENIPGTRFFKGYRVFACDGSDVRIPYNPDDPETFLKNDENSQGYNQLHLNALYDVLNRVYTDAMIDTKQKSHEKGALLDMLKAHDLPAKTIITADRGYESYELLAYMLENSIHFAIRIKDIFSSGILSAIDLPDEEFDRDITRILTRSQTKEIKQNKQKYVFLPSNVNFSYLDFDHPFYNMTFRVARFKITDGTYECLVTNLPKDEFSITELKELYHMRWEIEGAFRHLKYDTNMVYFNSIKQKNARQEIYAALIMYNYTQLLINAGPVEKDGRKWTYQIAFKPAVTNARLFLKKLITTKAFIDRIKNFLSPVRPGRKFKRNIKSQPARLSLYRAA